MKTAKDKNIWSYIKNYRADSLFFRNLILIFSLFLIPFIIMGIAYYRNIEKSAKENMEIENRVVIYEVRDIVDTILSEFDSMCSYVANDSSVQMFMINDWFVDLDEGNSADLFRSLNMAKYVYSYVDSVYVYSEYNAAVIHDDKMISIDNFTDLTWMDEYRLLEERRGITVPRSEAGVYPLLISIIKPIYVDNVKKGAVIFNIDSSRLYRSLKNMRYGDEQNIFLINNKGQVILGEEQYFGKYYENIDDISDMTENMNGFIREVNGEKSLISSVSSEKFNFFYINISQNSAYFKRMSSLRLQIIALILLVLLLSVSLAYFVALKNYRPVTEIISVLDNPESFDVSGDMTKFNELRYIAKSIVEQSKENVEIQRELEDKLQKLKNAQLDVLQTQINPHFLYNTLETINWMAVELTGGNNEVSRAVSNLAKFFRTNVGKGNYIISVREEVERTRYYLNILTMRYGDMFTVEWDISEEIMDYRIIKICLQPIIENAVYHGLKPKGKDGQLKITGYGRDDAIEFIVADNGVGMSAEKLGILNERLKEADYMGESHIGLYNINKRIKIIFGEEYGIRVESEMNTGTKTVVTLPKAEL